jgi:UDP-N-acetyl-D-glucosamine dehydrogenase
MGETVITPKEMTADDHAGRLAKAIENKTARIAIVGMGYVGLPLACVFAEHGFQTIGFDIDDSKISQLLTGSSYIKHIGDDRIGKLVSGGRLDATGDFNRLTDVDVIIVCVPTPLNRNREPEMAYVVSTAKSISKSLKRGQLVILESSTYPGCTAEVFKPELEKCGLKADADFFLAYSPEREDPGNPTYSTERIPKIVGGSCENSARLAQSLYQSIVVEAILVPNMETAEAVKLTENIFRAVNIALVNELKVIYDKMDVDIWDVVKAASTKPFGYMPFYPGPGLGGHCIPIDPFYLTWKAREYGINTRFIELSGEINRSMPQHVMGKLAGALSDKCEKSIRGSKVLLIGVAYKKNVDDMRESPSLEIWSLLNQAGADVDYHDPYVPIIPQTREHADLAGAKSVELLPENVSKFDAVLICTDHDNIDYGKLLSNSGCVIDTRNVMSGIPGAADRVVKA